MKKLISFIIIIAFCGCTVTVHEQAPVNKTSAKHYADSIKQQSN